MGSQICYFCIERIWGAQSQQTIEELKASADPERLAEMGETIGGLLGLVASPMSTFSSPALSESETSSVSSVPALNLPLISPVPSLEPPSQDVMTSIQRISPGCNSC